MPARRHRLARGEDFRRIVRRGIPIRGKLCLTYVAAHPEEDAPLPSRFGVIAAKSVGNAVVRNTVRRRVHHIVDEELAHGFAGFDVVFRMFPSSAHAPYTALRDDVQKSLARALSRGSADGSADRAPS